MLLVLAFCKILSHCVKMPLLKYQLTKRKTNESWPRIETEIEEYSKQELKRIGNSNRMRTRESQNTKGEIKGFGLQLNWNDKEQKNPWKLFKVKIHYFGIIGIWKWFNMIYLNKNTSQKWFDARQAKKYSSVQFFTVVKTKYTAESLDITSRFKAYSSVWGLAILCCNRMSYTRSTPTRISMFFLYCYKNSHRLDFHAF
jgi:hypothetical protein